MTKLNRRDCLIGMGAVIGSTALNGSLSAHATEQKRSALPFTASEAPRDWNPAWVEPNLPVTNPNEIVKLIFYGLTGFCSRQLQPGVFGCDVGFHDRGDASHHHHLYVQAFSGSRCQQVYANSGHERIEQLGLRVPQVTERFPALRDHGAHFFQPLNLNAPTRRSDLTNPQDFRWIMDFESNYLYRKFGHNSLAKRDNVYHPAFTIPHGVFYTMHKTANKFHVKTNGNQHKVQLGSVADWIGANVYVKAGTRVELEVNGEKKSVQAPGEIYFMNACFKSEDHMRHCDRNPNGPKEERSDFYLNYKAFKRESSPELELHIEESATPPPLILPLSCLDTAMKVLPKPADEHGMKSMLISDEAPCAGAGYSGGGGLPPSPIV